MATFRETARRRYQWPEFQLNVWLLVVLAGSATCTGVFAWFIAVQSQLNLGVPWYSRPHRSRRRFANKRATQAISLHDHRRVPRRRLCHPHPYPCLAAILVTRHHHLGQLHPLRIVVDGSDRDVSPAIWLRSECERELSEFCHEHAVLGEYDRGVGVADAE